MSSGSLKDLTKAISSPTNLTLPLPDDLIQLLNNYLEKHLPHEDTDSQRLHEELLTIYDTHVLPSPSRLGPFLAILTTLKPAIRGSGRLLQWWDKLAEPVLQHISGEKGLAFQARKTLLDILIHGEDEEAESEMQDAKETSDKISQDLIEIWLLKTRLANEEFDKNALFIEGQLRLILLAFGKKRPKDFLTSINQYFVKKESRILALSLLCEFIRHQPPHLHQLLQTPLFENLLKCLQIDTSTRVISLAMTALIMILPHIPSSLASYLPALFNIYSRMLFWDRERRASDTMKVEQDDTKSEKSQQVSEDGKSWVKLAYLLESEDETVPELLHYFTFLYGLYPINFMSYIRKPQRYLRHADFPGADDLDIEPSEIRARSEPFRQVHLLHPNFFMLTIESELTDTNRWMKSEAADVVAECMALYNSVDDKPSPTGRSRGPTKKIDPNSDVPEQSLLEEEAHTPYQSRHTSWRNTQSTAVASPNPDRSSGIQRKTSNTSQSLPSIADSPPFTATDRRDADDSPTIPPQILSSQPHLTDMLNSQKSIRGSIYQSLTNDSVNSLPLSNNRHEHIDNYLSSLARETIPRSPSLRPANIAPSAKADYLHREIQLLRNDLNFEQYLKAQHLSHIGQLRRKQIRDARVEAETQNLINSNRQLKSKLEEAKRINTQIKKETEKSKTHSRKWEAELTGKLRLLREEQKKWIAEKNKLDRDLARATETVDKLRGLVVSSESRELGVRQKVKAVESSLEELARLRTEVEKLAFSLRQYEAGELAALRAIESEKMAQSKVKNLEMQLEARDKEMFQTKQAFESQIEELRLGQEEYLADVAFGRRRKEGYTQDMMDAALSASRNRVAEIQKAHYHLLDRYHALQAAFAQLKEYHDEHDVDDEPLLSGGSSRPQFMNSDIYGSPSPTARAYNRHIETIPESGDNERTSSPFRRPPARLDTVSNLNTSYMMTTPTEGRSPISGGHHFQGAQPYSPTGDRGAGGGKGSIDEHSLDAAGKQKIKPQSEVRVYGRGGVQNIGKTEKDKKDKKDKDKAKDKDGKDGQKKSLGIRGIRGFV